MSEQISKRQKWACYEECHEECESLKRQAAADLIELTDLRAALKEAQTLAAAQNERVEEMRKVKRGE